MKKYEMTSNIKEFLGHKLFQIRALKDFGDVKAGDFGGYIEKEENLSQYGNAWVYDNVKVYNNAKVFCDAQVHGNAQIYDSASVYGNARVFDDAQVLGNARVFGDVQILDNALICDSADYICFKGFGSKSRNTTMFRTRNGNIIVKCGCFTGNLKEFSEKIKETHNNTKYAKEYLVCIEAAKIHFEIDEQLYKQLYYLVK